MPSKGYHRHAGQVWLQLSSNASGSGKSGSGTIPMAKSNAPELPTASNRGISDTDIDTDGFPQDSLLEGDLQARNDSNSGSSATPCEVNAASVEEAAPHVDEPSSTLEPELSASNAAMRPFALVEPVRVAQQQAVSVPPHMTTSSKPSLQC
ncbi:hypothetical protein LY76DRAFT_605827 [Colletotrichum caudatum]|nr:hypothetical protein LY76DRAFT_605827 [Colletotrichum caudatum]